jgi:tetratricopeptide (TPR) repeat protein
MPAETVAWYHTMVGHGLIDLGKLDEGVQSCKEALAIFPRDYRAMTGLAEAAASRHDWQGAVTWGQKAIETSPQNPEAFKILGDAYAELGQTSKAEQKYQLLEQLAHSFPRIYDRHWALFCADKGSKLDHALTLARKDLELRQDLHAYDTLAWVCFKKGLQKEAEAAMEKALSQGTAEMIPVIVGLSALWTFDTDSDAYLGMYPGGQILTKYATFKTGASGLKRP